MYDDTITPRGPEAEGGAPGVEGPTGAAAWITPFFNAILAPAQTWEALAAKPSLSVGIMVWIMALSTVMAVVNLPITQQIMVQSTRAAMRAQGQDMSPEQLQQMNDSMMMFGSIIAYGSSLLILLGVAVIALMIWVLAALMGGKGATFGRAFGVAAAAGVIHPLIYSLYAGIILNMNPPQIRRPSDASTMMPTLGLDLVLAGPDTPAWLEVLFQRIDLFSLWWGALVVSGCMTLMKLRKGQGITVAAIIWLFFTVIAMLGALAQGMNGS